MSTLNLAILLRNAAAGTYEYVLFDGEFYYPDGCTYVMDDFGTLVEVDG